MGRRSCPYCSTLKRVSRSSITWQEEMTSNRARRVSAWALVTTAAAVAAFAAARRANHETKSQVATSETDSNTGTGKQPEYHLETLSVMTQEATRARQLQSTRIANMHGRAGFLLGASGLAAGLTATQPTTVQELLAMTAFALAALLALLMLIAGTQRLSSPRNLLDAGDGTSAHQLSYEVVDAIAIEWEEGEVRLKKLDFRAQWSVFAFTIGIVLLVLNVTLPVQLPPIPSTPVHVVIDPTETP